MKLAALCCTFNRPHLLGQLIESFLRQDYPAHLRELVILDDAGQYEHQEGPGWRLVSIPRRFRTLGEKRNACAALASSDVQGFLVADDDDIYLPHWFSTQARALAIAQWSRPSLVLLENENGLHEADTGGLYHGGWAYRREAFERVRGYGPLNNGEDQEFSARLSSAGTTVVDPSKLAAPFYFYRVDNGSYHVSHLDDTGYQSLGDGTRPKASVQVGWPQEFDKLPVRKKFAFAPHVSHGSGPKRIELIGPVNAPGGDGPSNGMYALQKELRKRIAEGLDWLTIKPLPASRDAIPWFWNWHDRSYACWWNSQGLPFIQGPNMLFTNSRSPRIDAEECALLDAKHCVAMFCHSQWYRDLIAANRGPENQSPIHMWPYPIDPLPGPPLPVEYDLLIYAKNGHRPGLLEHLAELYPRHIQIHYGQYQRDQLYEAARRSRACAYLADDDHGPLALAEILLAGCPVVGVPTGAPFVEHGSTGLYVEHLPAGRENTTTPQGLERLDSYLHSLDRCGHFERLGVRNKAADIFTCERIIDGLAAILRQLSGSH